MTQERKRGPALRFPPPAIFTIVFLVALWLEAAVYRTRLADPMPRLMQVIGVGLVVAGLALAVWAMVVFTRARTTFIPFRDASALVRAGPYRFSRNPIYVGDVLVYLGAALLFNAGWTLLLLPVAVLWLHLHVIRKDYAHLQEVFGKDYTSYRAEVRRWI